MIVRKYTSSKFAFLDLVAENLDTVSIEIISRVTGLDFPLLVTPELERDGSVNRTPDQVATAMASSIRAKITYAENNHTDY